MVFCSKIMYRSIRSTDMLSYDTVVALRNRSTIMLCYEIVALNAVTNCSIVNLTHKFVVKTSPVMYSTLILCHPLKCMMVWELILHMCSITYLCTLIYLLYRYYYRKYGHKEYITSKSTSLNFSLIITTHHAVFALLKRVNIFLIAANNRVTPQIAICTYST